MYAFELGSARLKVLKGMSIGVGSLAFFLSFINFFVQQHYIYGLIEVIYAAYSFYVYLEARKGVMFNGHKYILTAFLTFLIVAGTSIKPTANGLFFWTLALPIIYYLLLGRKIGFIASISLFVVQIANIYYQFYVDQYFNILSMMLNFSFCYFTVAAIAHVYEVDRVSSEKKLSKLASVDSLTNANNRLALKHRLDDLEKNATPFHLLVLDIDHFKAINDQFGHDGGDVVLQSVVKTMSNIAGGSNVFRQGGEEFCIILQNCSISEALLAAETIRDAISNTSIAYRSNLISVTASIGLAEASTPYSLYEVSRKADACLYQAKSEGRNTVITHCLG